MYVYLHVHALAPFSPIITMRRILKLVTSTVTYLRSVFVIITVYKLKADHEYYCVTKGESYNEVYIYMSSLILKVIAVVLL